MSKAIKSRQRRNHIDWDYNGDGCFRKDRIKGVIKKYWARWRRREDVKIAFRDLSIDR